jgi:ubiquinone/menaquinone biosynthesis C-methylase UbiE
MTYKAKTVYQDPLIALGYDKHRFRSLKGRLVDKREKCLISKAIAFANILPPAKILDVPSGTGRLSHVLAEKGFHVTGVDISSAMIEESYKKLSKRSPKDKVIFEIGDAESLSFPDSFFDVGVSLRLFGHLPPKNRQGILNELSRVSKSFVVTAYYLKNCIQGLIRSRMRAQRGISWYPVRFRQIYDELDAANLEWMATFFLLPGVSETVIVLSRKLKD